MSKPKYKLSKRFFSLGLFSVFVVSFATVLFVQGWVMQHPEWLPSSEVYSSAENLHWQTICASQLSRSIGINTMWFLMVLVIALTLKQMDGKYWSNANVVVKTLFALVVLDFVAGYFVVWYSWRSDSTLAMVNMYSAIWPGILFLGYLLFQFIQVSTNISKKPEFVEGGPA